MNCEKTLSEGQQPQIDTKSSLLQINCLCLLKIKIVNFFHHNPSPIHAK
jgi:hypothetical protein